MDSSLANPRRQTNKELLEAIAINELPAELQSKLEGVRIGIQALKAEAACWGVKREFSADGRFLGDVGELIANLFYGVKLNVKQQKGHDAVTAEADGTAEVAGHKVEVKLRSRSTHIHFFSVPDRILVVYVSPESLKWGEVCNGPGRKLLQNIELSKQGSLKTDCVKLIRAQNSIQEHEKLRRSEPQRPIS